MIPRMITSIKNTEFTSTPSGDIEIRQEGAPVVMYERNQLQFTELMLEYIRQHYTEAYEALAEEYAHMSRNKVNYDYRMVHRFIRCNWQEYDDKEDIDGEEVAHFEKVHINCPMRGECKYFKIICDPKYSSALTNKEMDVMRLYYEGMGRGQIADELCISINTLDKHRQNVLKKTGMNSLTEFNTYARKNNLFNQK